MIKDAAIRWFSKANARAVVRGLLVLLVLVAAWWTWKEFEPAIMKREAAPFRPRRDTWTELGLRRLVEHYLAAANHPPKANPFADALLKEERINPAIPNVTLQRPPPGESPPASPPSAPRPPKVPPVRLLYRGMIAGTDGRRMALVHDSKASKVTLCRIGDRIHGMEVLSIDVDGVVLSGPGDEHIPLKLRESKAFDGAAP